MIKIYFAKITDFTQADYATMYSLLDCAMKIKIDCKKCDSDKMRSLAGYILFYKGIKELYGKTELNIIFNQHGKPLCDFCFFSISHSGEQIVCAFADKPIGIDIQKINVIKPREKYKFFNQKENDYVNRSADLLSERFIEIFTKKEAAVKALGLPLSYAASVDTFSTEFYFESKKRDGYMVTLCQQNV